MEELIIRNEPYIIGFFAGYALHVVLIYLERKYGSKEDD